MKTIHEAAEQLNVSPATVRRLIHLGHLQSINVGTGLQRRSVRIRDEEIERFISGRKIEPVRVARRRFVRMF